jgi:hypothetical protein
MTETATAQRERVFLQPLINSTRLAGLNQADVCECCFALTCVLTQQRAVGGKKIPHLIPLPGIFRSIDSHVKQVVHASLDQEGVLPPWFPDLGHRVNGYVPTPLLHWSRFKMVDVVTGIKISGSPDDVRVLLDLPERPPDRCRRKSFGPGCVRESGAIFESSCTRREALWLQV